MKQVFDFKSWGEPYTICCEESDKQLVQKILNVYRHTKDWTADEVSKRVEYILPKVKEILTPNSGEMDQRRISWIVGKVEAEDTVKHFESVVPREEHQIKLCLGAVTNADGELKLIDWNTGKAVLIENEQELILESKVADCIKIRLLLVQMNSEKRAVKS